MIRVTIAILFSTFFFNLSHSQFTLDLNKGMTYHLQESLDIDGAEISITMPSQFAHNYVIELVEMTGLPMTFKLVQSREITKAMAYLTREDAYLVYNESFLNQIKQNSYNDWSAIYVLIHEIGHLLIKHPESDAEDIAKRREHELQADHFAGFWLNKLGATSQEAIQYTEKLKSSSNGFHPGKEQRIHSIIAGWNKANKKYKQHNLQHCNSQIGSITFVNETNTSFVLLLTNARSYSSKKEISISPGTSKTIDLNVANGLESYKYSANKQIPGFYSSNAAFSGTIKVIPCKTQVVILK